ncbi:caspase family protein [Flammeovirga sp. MY04]|uniref:caspase family protein n=1 Tax=Flammeovirga sp. MY04 TaxID=1191459 RepID=UPI0009FC42C3|nr:caspase family protein [Flammeovirga sp. MY04]ANQ48685.2 caspase family protein [Flammeovirga sp. MY04]
MKSLYCSIILFLFSFSLFAKEKHALIIGIDKYTNSKKARYAEWQDLDGAVNDATSIYDLLKFKYGFNSKNMSLLTSEKQTTKKNIIKNFEDLIKVVEKGDDVFIYYAGHGAQIKNSKFYEADKKHEALVPSDVLKTGDYLLDVEINTYFSRIIGKGGELVVVFDNCFSGSSSRGKIDLEQLRSRYVPVDDIDLDRSYPKSKNLVEKGALIVSAAQDYQLAKEYKDDRGQSHGVFTYALMKSLQMGSVHESSEDIFKRVNSIILYNSVPRQDPVIEATKERLGKPLFGEVSDSYQGVRVAVIDAENKYKIHIDGGNAIGLVEGAELINQDKDITLEVTELSGINTCFAKLVKGDDNLSEGDLLTVSKWAPFSPDRLKVKVMKMGVTDIDLEAIKSLSQTLNEAGLLAYSPLEEDVSLKVYLTDKGWMGSDIKNEEYDFGKKLPKSSKLVDILHKKVEGKKIFIEVPPSTKVAQSMYSDLNGQPKVEIVASEKDYDYRLIGRFNENNNLEYAWLRAHAHNNSNENPFPDETDWKTDQKIYVLTDYAKRLGNVKGWLVTKVPNNTVNFPYKLGLQRESDQKIITEGALTEGEKYGLVLYNDPNLYLNWKSPDRYIYVFLLESNGEMTLLFPQNHGAVENFTEQICKDDNGDYLSKVMLSDPDLLYIEPPFSTDNILMLSTEKIITDTSIFEQKGVQTRGADDSFDDFMEGDKDDEPANWFLERHTFFGESIK